MEAYRKMQQLRRDFGKARELLQLVLERETLRETQSLTQKEIFNLQVLELDLTDQLGLKNEYFGKISNDNSNTNNASSDDNNVTNNNSDGSNTTTIGSDNNNNNNNNASTITTIINNDLLKPVGKYKLLYPHLLDTPVVPKTPIAMDMPLGYGNHPHNIIKNKNNIDKSNNNNHNSSIGNPTRNNHILKLKQHQQQQHNLNNNMEHSNSNSGMDINNNNNTNEEYSLEKNKDRRSTGK